MKNYLILLKKALTKNKNVYVPKVEQDDTKTDKLVVENVEENKKIINIANALKLEFAIHRLKKCHLKVVGMVQIVLILMTVI